MLDEKLTINIFIVNFSSYMQESLHSTMNYVCKVCNPTILNLPIL
jgi:hypothetical protein